MEFMPGTVGTPRHGVISDGRLFLEVFAKQENGEHLTRHFLVKRFSGV